ncbi:MAG: c-type cytochrome [Candidatus Promineifilaceae bacterium]
MKRKVLLAVLVLALVLLLAACGGADQAATGGDSGSTPVGDAAHGKELYEQTVIGSASAPGCVTCHSLEPDTVLVGPSHAGVATRAASYQEGVSAEDYLRTSITNPDDHIVEGFTPGVMYQNYAEDLSARDINDLVAYLLTLK